MNENPLVLTNEIKRNPRWDKFDPELATRLAGISNAAYSSGKAFVHKLRTLGMDDWKYEFMTKDNAQCYVVWSDKEKEIYIAWRGTEPGEYKDVLADLKIKKVLNFDGFKVHRGFKGYVDKLYDQVESRVERVIKGKWFKIFVTGHSLGGASALICTNRLESKFHVEACYTYGAPRPGSWKYAYSFKTPVFRVRNNNDLVTKVPLMLLGYKHVGSLVYIDRHGVLRTGKVKFVTLLKNWFWGQFQRLGDGLRDHSIGEYCMHLKNAERIHKED